MEMGQAEADHRAATRAVLAPDAPLMLFDDRMTDR
jgi:hypothetical protein